MRPPLAILRAALALLILAALPAWAQANKDASLDADIAALKVDLNGVWAPDPKRSDFFTPPHPKTVRMGIWQTGLPARYFLTVDKVTASLVTGEGVPIAIQEAPAPTSPCCVDIPALKAALAPVELYASDGLGWSMIPMFNMSAPDLARHWSSILKYSTTIDFGVAEYVVAAHIPLEPRQRAAGIELRDIDHDDNSLTIIASPLQENSRSELTLALVNTSTREALLGQPALSTQPRTLVWIFSDADTPTGKLLTKQWLAGAEIVALERRKVAAFTRSFQKDHLQLSFDIPGQRGLSSDVDTKALSAITLPPQATKSQMLDYVRAIMAVSRSQKRLGYEDPQVAMLMDLGPGNLDILIEALPPSAGWKDLHLSKAIRELVARRHRMLILSRLADRPHLAEVLEDCHGLEDARPILLDGLAARRPGLPASWFTAILTYHDPSTYGPITDYFLADPTIPGLYEVVREIPGVEMSKIMPTAWAKSKAGDLRDQSFMIHGACQAGINDALDTAAQWLRTPASDYARRVGRRVLTEYTLAKGTDEELLAWYDTNKSTLAFDPDRKIFKPKP